MTSTSRNATPSPSTGTPLPKPDDEAPAGTPATGATRTTRRKAVEQAVDRMVEDSFPASDATQLPGRADDAPPASASTRKGSSSRSSTHVEPEPRRIAPRTIGNQGVVPASRMREDTVKLGTDEVTLRLDAAHRQLELRFSDAQLALDAKALDRLIEALSTKRTQMG